MEEEDGATGHKRRKMLSNTHMQQEAALEAALFGGDDPLAEFGREAGAGGAATAVWADPADAAAEVDEAPAPDSALLWEDRQGGASGRQPDEPDGREPPTRRARRGGAVWQDPADAEVRVEVAGRSRLRKLRREENESVLSGPQYEGRLRAQHKKLNPRTGWARARPDDEGAARDLAAGGALGRPSRLPRGTIEVTPLADANRAEPSDAVVRCVEFHPNGQLLLTAGLDKRLRLFNVDGVRNRKVQSVFLEDMPVHHAAFAAGGNQIVAAGRRKHFYIYDLGGGNVSRIAKLAGVPDKSLESFVVSPASAQSQKPTAAFLCDEGRIELVSLQSRQVTGTLKMAGSVRAAAFSPDGDQLLSLGGDGVVHTWDLRTQRCLRREVDEGCIRGASLAASASFYATGSDAGVVNLHSRKAAGSPAGGLEAAAAEGAPAPPGFRPPLKALMNLRTTVDSLAFSPDQQILAMGSRMAKGALRLLHVPSRTVFANWPTPQTPLQFVHSVAFSPNGGLLAVGTARGRALLYRLNHYSAA